MPLLTHTPTFSPADAAAITAQRYGIIATATPLPGERDQNFRLENTTGETFVLKIANGLEDAGLLAAQTDALRRVESTGICPRVLPTADGAWMTQIDGVDGSRHWVRLLTFLPGTPLGRQRRQTPAMLGDVGRRVAQVDAAHNIEARSADGGAPPFGFFQQRAGKIQGPHQKGPSAMR